MEGSNLTLTHGVFLSIVLLIFLAIAFRRGVIIPSIAGIFIIGLMAEGPVDGSVLDQLIFGLQVVFRALLNAGVELFDIMLVIALMVSMLKSLQATGADQIMVAPLSKLMVGPKSAYFVLATAMYIASAFFWPTPAVALVGTVLIPVAIKMGLPAIGAAVAVNLAGHGMALSADPVIQGATRLTGGAAGLDTNELLPYTMLFSFVAGSVALAISGFWLMADLRRGKIRCIEPPIQKNLERPEEKYTSESFVPGSKQVRCARSFGIGVPLVLACIAGLMICRAVFNPDLAIRGGDATALLGGTAILLLVLSTSAHCGLESLDEIATHIREGFFFSIKIFAPIIPIAGFFFLGNPEHAEKVVGEGTPGFLFDVGAYIGSNLDGSTVLLTLGVTLVGVLAGMDGSGFSGLPLVGSLSGSLAAGAGLDVAVLAGLGQVVTIFTGGGTLVAWAFGACADAGIAGVSPAELVRRNFIPIAAGLLVANAVALYLL